MVGLHERTDETFHQGQLLDVDEVSLSGALSPDSITALATEAVAKRYWSATAPNSSRDDAGASSTLVHGGDQAPELFSIHRFTSPWESPSPLGLRHGRSEGIDTYMKRHRLTRGDTEAMIDPPTPKDG